MMGVLNLKGKFDKNIEGLIIGVATTAVTIFMLTGSFPSVEGFPFKEFIVGSAVGIALHKYVF